jgi:hypothetical protein
MDRFRRSGTATRLGGSNGLDRGRGAQARSPHRSRFSSRPGGALISWRTVGVDIAVREPWIPFFIQWGDGLPLPGTAAARHRGGPATLERLSVPADQERLADWLGDHDLPIDVTGASGTSAMTLTRAEVDFTLE